MPGLCLAAKIALTFDDLPLNGSLPKGVSEADVARDVVAILRARKLPPSYGFVNARNLEDKPLSAEGLKIWRNGGQRVGNHTYSHASLHDSTPEAFEREIAQNEPAHCSRQFN